MVEIIFYSAVIVMSILIFFMEITTKNAFFELILKTAGKVIPLFCILYAGLKLFKLFNIEI